MFVPGRNEVYLEWRDTWLRLTFEGQRTVEITSTVVATELVAESPAEFRDYIASEDGVVLDSPTSDQREIFAAAMNGTYTECKPYSDAFTDVREQLSTRDDRPVLLVRYLGDWYFARLSG